MNNPTVSIITRCKGRRKHLEETLTLFFMQNYYRTEVIIVNYNSPDGLHDWLQEEYKKQIEIGRLVEVQVKDTLYFDHPHSRNVGLRAAIGEWVLYLDADNKPAPRLIPHLLKRIPENCFAMIGHPAYEKSGIFFVKRQDLMDLGGFMENLQGWGYEDGDMRDRLFAMGREMFSFDPRLVQTVAHKNYERWMYLKPPFNKPKDGGIIENRDKNAEIAGKYIQEHGIVANKDKAWGEGGIVLCNHRFLEKPLRDAAQDITHDLKGAYLFQFKDDKLVNEKQLLRQGCPQAYIAEVKRQRREGSMPQHQLKLAGHDLRKITVQPPKGDDQDDIIVEV